MKEAIEQALFPLLSQPLWAISRAANMEGFQFGERHFRTPRFGNREPVEVGDYAIHIQCAWRIVDSERIIVASRDMYEPVGELEEVPADFDWDVQGANRCDERVSALLALHTQRPLQVIAIAADVYGGFQLILSEGYALQVFPNASCSGEHWRLFKPGTDEDHFVVSGKGIES